MVGAKHFLLPIDHVVVFRFGLRIFAFFPKHLRQIVSRGDGVRIIGSEQLFVHPNNFSIFRFRLRGFALGIHGSG